jgi:hypothetical protein
VDVLASPTLALPGFWLLTSSLAMFFETCFLVHDDCCIDRPSSSLGRVVKGKFPFVLILWLFPLSTSTSQNELESFIHSPSSKDMPKPMTHTNRSMILIARKHRLFQEPRDRELVSHTSNSNNNMPTPRKTHRPAHRLLRLLLLTSLSVSPHTYRKDTTICPPSRRSLCNIQTRGLPR